MCCGTGGNKDNDIEPDGAHYDEGKTYGLCAFPETNQKEGVYSDCLKVYT